MAYFNEKFILMKWKFIIMKMSDFEESSSKSFHDIEAICLQQIASMS